MAERTVVFAGPSLPVGWLPAEDHRLLPPARRGDVLAAMAQHEPAAIVLLDGYYGSVPAVTHKELLYALDAGLTVVGAASMGALRAVELAPYGMLGVGRVYERFRDGELDGDDEVAVLHAPGHLGYRAVTVALVEVREALGAMLAEASVETDRSGAEALVRALKRICFVERTHDRIERLAARRLPAATVAALMERLAGDSVKQRDARAAIEHVDEAHRARPRRARASTGYLDRFLERSLSVRTGPHGRAASLDRAWKVAQVLHPDSPQRVAELRRRHALAAYAREQGLAVDTDAVDALAGRWRQEHRDRFGHALMPAPEYAAEARIELLSHRAAGHAGSEESALEALAGHLRLPTTDPCGSILGLIANQPDQIPGWHLARAFATGPAIDAALAVAAEALELRDAHIDLTEGARIREASLLELAAELWNCPPGEVVREGARRALFFGAGVSATLIEALELIAVAERLPSPLNEYPARRAELRSCPLVTTQQPALTPTPEAR